MSEKANGNGILNKRARTSSQEPIIGTHSGVFHCDEALACYMLRQLPEYENAGIFRSRNVDELRQKCEIIVDVGGEFDHARNWYDHHQQSFKATLSDLRPELSDEFNIRLSSAGLIYTYYGERVIDVILKREKGINLSPEHLQLCFVQIYRNFISEIDAIDNGVPMFENEEQRPLYTISTHLSARVSHLNPSWEEAEASEEEIYKRFQQAIALVGSEFTATVLRTGGNWIKAREFVRAALLEAPNVYSTGEILVLETFCPWKVHLADLEREYKVEGKPKLVLFQDSTGKWRVSGVPKEPDSYLGRKFLPVAWRGLRNNDLCEIAGLPDLEFVHHTGFIGGAKNKQAALAMAIKSVECQDEKEALNKTNN